MKNPLQGEKSAGTGVPPNEAPFQDRGARRVGWVDLRTNSNNLSSDRTQQTIDRSPADRSATKSSNDLKYGNYIIN
ncbi:hypothetical protein [Chamaesiphon sp.]|uniref:hypothetical protein n=1 Tax=Chamaesiphon sp. TaxID=2814140 RepID=UPI00359447B7